MKNSKEKPTKEKPTKRRRFGVSRSKDAKTYTRRDAAYTALLKNGDRFFNDKADAESVMAEVAHNHPATTVTIEPVLGRWRLNLKMIE